MIVGFFEILFFYEFLRRNFEKAFGTIPSIILAAFFYSFHHIGFQPELIKLFLVGIFFASVSRLTNNILVIYPFFWGVGGIWDILVEHHKSSKIMEFAWIKYSMIRALLILVLIIIFLGYIIYIKKRKINQRKPLMKVRK
jgi:hypothetical protein